jgi:uncharacterized membrane protein YedE/YeeE
MTMSSTPAPRTGSGPAAASENPVRLVVVLACGALFGFGLALSTMIRPEVVLGFLRFQDMGLMLVLGGAVAVTLLAYQLAPRRMAAPWLGGPFRPHPSALNRDTLVGSALFGIGWGLTGVCPGPAIAGLGAGAFELLAAVAGLALGAGLHGWTRRSPPAGR